MNSSLEEMSQVIFTIQVETVQEAKETSEAQARAAIVEETNSTTLKEEKKEVEWVAVAWAEEVKAQKKVDLALTTKIKEMVQEVETILMDQMVPMNRLKIM